MKTQEEKIKEIIKKILREMVYARGQGRKYKIEELKSQFELSIIKKHIGEDKFNKLIDELGDLK